jgi:hypothetical protein
MRATKTILSISIATLINIALPAAAQPTGAPPTGAPTAPPTAPLVIKPGIPPKPARLADGHPNWTGFWVSIGGLLESYRGPSFQIRIPGAGPPPGIIMRPSPLKSPYKEKYEQDMKDMAAGKVNYDPAALCLPPGMPGMMNMIYGMELLQTPGQITMTSEWQSASRRVWLDRSTHPDPDELDPTYAGDSIGHWEGDTLVIDTVGLRTDMHLDQIGLPISPKLRLTERIKQIQPGILEDEITIDDPDVFTTPWKSVKTYRHRPDLRLKEYVCEENNRNVGANGRAEFPK